MFEGMAEVTSGADSKDLNSLANDYSKLAKYLSVDKEFDEDSNVYTAGVIFWRYFMRQAADHYESSTPDTTGADTTTLTVTDKTKSPVTVGSTVKTINASKRTTSDKITGNTLANTITGDTIYGKASNDSITGNDGADKISGGDGADTLKGGKGNDTLTGGAGKDVFIYTAGNDVIADYATGDKISLNASISGASVKGADATFKLGSNTLTVKNGKGKKIIFVNSKGKEREIIGGAFLATNSTSKNNTLVSWREVADASERTKAIKIVGNARDNIILGGSANDSLYGGSGKDTLLGNAGDDKLYGQNGNDSLVGGDGKDTLSGGADDDKLYGQNGNDSLVGGDGKDTLSGGAGNDKLYGNSGNDSLVGGDGKDTLSGGAGNDKLWGNSGADTFIYSDGDGNDIIYGFENNDLLQITGAFSGTYSKSKGEVYFKVGTTSKAITLSDFSTTYFNVNGNVYQISSSKLVKK